MIMPIQQIQRINGKHLEEIAEKIFEQRFFEVYYNDYSPICAMIAITDTDNLMMQDIKDLEYYGYKTTMINKQDLGFVLHVYQSQS